jgi:hypothetical protein
VDWSYAAKIDRKTIIADKSIKSMLLIIIENGIDGDNIKTKQLTIIETTRLIIIIKAFTCDLVSSDLHYVTAPLIIRTCMLLTGNYSNMKLQTKKKLI